MPKIIYVQQHVGDNGRKFSPSRNAHYVKYIGEREHVLKASHETNLVKYMGEREHAAKHIDKLVKEEAEHLVTYDSDTNSVIEYDAKIDDVSMRMQTEPENGLFGYIDGSFSDEYSTADMQKYVRRISTPHRNVFHSIFSFTPDSAEDAGLKSLDDWECWTRYHINDIANGMNMKIENIEYLAAVHLKEGQPHVHIMWWDKAQQVLINKVDPLVCDKIRIDVTRSTYREMFSKIYNQEEIMRRELRKSIGQYTLNNVIGGAADDYTMHIMAGIQKVAMLFPMKGQFKYGFIKQDSPVKAELDKLTHYIIDNNPSFKKKYDEICAQRLLYNQLLHSDASKYGNYQIDRYVKQVNDKVERAVGNEILRIIKSEKLAGRLNAAEAPQTDIPDEPPAEDESGWNTQTLNKSQGTRYRINWSDKFKSARELVKSKMYDEALKLYAEEADKGNVLALYEIGDLYRRKLVSGADPNKFYKAALEGFLQLEPSAKKIAAYIRYRIGRMYYDGYGTQTDYNAAYGWLKKADDDNHHFAAYTVGKMLYHGQGVQQDTIAAAEYLKRAAGEVPAAKVMLGRIYSDTETAEFDFEKAESYLLEAANSNDLYSAKAAEYALGKLYFARGESRYADSLLWLEKSFSHGNIYSALAAAKILSDSKTRFYNLSAAKEWLDKAIKQAEKDANSSELVSGLSYQLGRLNLSDKDYQPRQAEECLKRSVSFGNPYAMYTLAHLYINDDGVKDLNSAISLLNSAKISEPALSSLADYTLGTMYLFEKEIRDAALAKKYLAASANAGNEFAQEILNSQSADCILNLMNSVSRLLAENLESDRAALSECSAAVFGRGDLSKEQIRELVLKRQDKENTAEM